MNHFEVKAERKPAMILFFSLFILGFLFIAAPAFGLKAYIGVVQLLGFLIVVASLLVFNRYLLTNYIYEIETDPNAFSELPKLNIYASRGHNFGHQFYCIPFDETYAIEKWTEGKPDMPCYNSCGSLRPQERFLVTYDCEDSKHGILLECDQSFADEIARLIAQYSKMNGGQ